MSRSVLSFLPVTRATSEVLARICATGLWHRDSTPHFVFPNRVRLRQHRKCIASLNSKLPRVCDNSKFLPYLGHERKCRVYTLLTEIDAQHEGRRNASETLHDVQLRYTTPRLLSAPVYGIYCQRLPPVRHSFRFSLAWRILFSAAIACKPKQRPLGTLFRDLTRAVLQAIPIGCSHYNLLTVRFRAADLLLQTVSPRPLP
nr:hypothetical protein CFP56_69099 [Quercus suber]